MYALGFITGVVICVLIFNSNANEDKYYLDEKRVSKKKFDKDNRKEYRETYNVYKSGNRYNIKHFK